MSESRCTTADSTPCPRCGRPDSPGLCNDCHKKDIQETEERREMNAELAQVGAFAWALNRIASSGKPLSADAAEVERLKHENTTLRAELETVKGVEG